MIVAKMFDRTLTDLQLFAGMQETIADVMEWVGPAEQWVASKSNVFCLMQGLYLGKPLSMGHYLHDTS